MYDELLTEAEAEAARADVNHMFKRACKLGERVDILTGTLPKLPPPRVRKTTRKRMRRQYVCIFVHIRGLKVRMANCLNRRAMLDRMVDRFIQRQQYEKEIVAMLVVVLICRATSSESQIAA